MIKLIRFENWSFYKSSKINIKGPTKQKSQIIQNFYLFLSEWKAVKKGSKITEIRKKNKTRKTVTCETELGMLSCQKIERAIDIFLVVKVAARRCSSK